ncbi:blast:Tripartite motif-containing protein 45 [Mytilus galloprovincialis]|uniref:Blast:Tripartite motif-containing protein 45 n=1 Tax=Mytilus galloprovincialis TaxID=29158 RepID=A0A8B6BSW3_MYTGA|nr:blast:Tripartite motif-containing protein 45 [Mytilus galloprovincialis]
MASNILCGPCSHVNTHKYAQKWCTNCEEGFCTDCEQVHRSMKVTRNHTLISTDDYRKIEHVPVNLKCDTHDKKFDLYCKTHDVAICIACFPSLHKHCSDVIPLDEAAKNAKRSTALDDLVDSIKVVLENLKDFIKNRNNAMKNLEIEEQSVRKSISEMRANVNKHLDDLENKMLDDLSQRYENCKSKYGEVQKYLNKTEKEIKLLQEQTSQMRLVGSDLQVFLGTRQMNKLIHNEVQSVKSITSTLQDYKIGVEIHQGITSLLENVDNFGKVEVEENIINLPFKDAKVDQAQIVHTPTGQSFDRTTLQLRQKFKIKDENNKMNVRGCGILPNSHLLIADYNRDKVIMEYSDDGTHIRDIPVSDPPYDFAIIDSDRIAVTYGLKRNMEIFNINNKRVLAKETFIWGCSGISYQNGNIYILVLNEGIVEMDMSGKRLRTIGGEYAGSVCHIITTKDRIYCTDFGKDVVYCCSMRGEVMWTNTDKSLVNPRGISADGDENVFVVGTDSNNLMMIRHDGKVLQHVNQYDFAPCNRVSRRNSAQKWCTNCGKGFCADCEHAHRSMMVTADHTLISTNAIHKTENVAVIMIWDIHGKKFDLYCITHDLAICLACIPSKHKHCYDAVISLHEAANHAKTSQALDDVTDSVNVALNNMKMSSTIEI